MLLKETLKMVDAGLLTGKNRLWFDMMARKVGLTNLTTKISDGIHTTPRITQKNTNLLCKWNNLKMAALIN